MSKDIKKALEHCIEWNCDNCPNREELGSGETVCRGRLLPEVLEYVADLEAKLAEYEKFMKDNEWDSVEEIQETLNKCEKKYFDIQQELAGRKKLCDLRYKQLQNSHQDKISFALEQLEKVKNKIESKVESIYKILDDLNIRIVDESTSRQLSSYEEIVKDIDNQINELKGGK